YVTYKSFVNKKTDYKVVFFNGCMTGTEFFCEKFLEHIKTDVYIGWKKEVSPLDASNLAEKFFELCNTKKENSEEYYMVGEALLKAYNDCFPNDKKDNLNETKLFFKGDKYIILKVK
ncbi:MAG: hypothetical protein M0Q02_13430, partial [Candidatus Muirbacterium halophilum]|nr:hypothetical protein [Candidatus Muirbacterium halophilum]